MGIGLECLVVGILEYRDLCICVYNMIPLIIHQFVDVNSLVPGTQAPIQAPNRRDWSLAGTREYVSGQT